MKAGRDGTARPRWRAQGDVWPRLSAFAVTP